jgi:TolB protein
VVAAAVRLSLMPAGFAQQPPPPGTPTIIFEGGAQRFAVPACIPRAGDEASREACRTLTQVLRKDLDFEQIFRFVPENLMAAIPAFNPDAPNFTDWKGIGANILVLTRAQVVGGELTVEAQVYSVDTGQSMLAKRYSGRVDNPRIFAHQASDDIMTLTQYKGVARSRIAFVSDRDSQRKKISKELYIVDYDGFNPRRVTVNNSINILPAWKPDGRSLDYVSYRQGSPDVFVAHIFEGRSANITNGRGAQAFAPSFSPDGKRIAYASNRGGNMDIWVANADGSDARRVTATAASETAPFWSPTGQEIAFTSDRGGAPQIYVMDSEGLNVRRLTTVGNWNDAPAWNPSKQYSEIAYTSRLEGGFEVAVLDLASRQVRQITEGRGSCEFPTWAPNGRHLAFSCNRGGTWQITIADRDGRSVQTLATGPGNNVQPDWGP